MVLLLLLLGVAGVVAAGVAGAADVDGVAGVAGVAGLFAVFPLSWGVLFHDVGFVLGLLPPEKASGSCERVWVRALMHMSNKGCPDTS